MTKELIWNYIDEELARQQEGIELIASENFVSKDVLRAQGSILTNKYAEGYPKARYYGGCEVIDKIEQLAIDLAKKLFDAEYANVQPHSGSQANMAVYRAFLNDHDTILGMNLTHGGHLTHGSEVNFSGQSYNFVSYGVSREDECIDYNQLRELALQHKPKMIIAGASAYSRHIDFERIQKIAQEVDAYFMVDMAHIAGLVVAKQHQNPVPYADVVTSTTHKTLRGPRGGLILAKEKYAKKINSAIFPGIQGGPLEHVIGAKAIAFMEALEPSFQEYGRQIIANIKAMEEVFKKSKLRLISGGSDNHLLLLDVSPLNINGKQAQEALDKVGITVNKNTIPFEILSYFKTSGIRLGTPAITTRGFKEKDCALVAQFIVEVLENIDNPKVYETVRKQVKELTKKYPIY